MTDRQRGERLSDRGRVTGRKTDRLTASRQIIREKRWE